MTGVQTCALPIFYNKTKPNRELCELRNMIAVAYLVIKQGREIKESVGCHFNADYPKEN